MFDLGWGELLIIGVVALIVVGPKDLPGMFRTLGRFTGKVKGMAREFQSAMNDAADEAGIKETADMVKGAANPRKMGMDTLNDAAKKFEEWDPSKASNKTKDRGPETAKMTEERAANAAKIREYSTKKAGEKRAAEAAAAAKETAEAPAAKKAPAKKATAKKTAAKKPAAKKPAAKKKPAKKPEDKA